MAEDNRPTLEPFQTSPYVRTWHLHWFSDAEFWCAVTGTFGLYCRQTRHYWFGIPCVFNVRVSVSWGNADG